MWESERMSNKQVSFSGWPGAAAILTHSFYPLFIVCCECAVQMNKAQLDKLREAQEEVMERLAEREAERAREDLVAEDNVKGWTQELGGYLAGGAMILLATYIAYMFRGDGHDPFGYKDGCGKDILQHNSSLFQYSMGNLAEVSSSLKIPETSYANFYDFKHPYFWVSSGERIVRVEEDEGYGPAWYHVSVETDMAGITPAQFRSWWSYVNCSAIYALWHPLDHVYGVWLDTDAQGEWSHDLVIRNGMVHRVKEFVGGKLNYLDIIFLDPCLGIERDCDSLQNRFKASAVLHGHVTTHFPWFGRIKAGSLYHTLTRTEEGVSTLHSKFILGRDVDCVDYPNTWSCSFFKQISSILKRFLLGETQVRAIYRHCKEEMFILGRLISRLGKLDLI